MTKVPLHPSEIRIGYSTSVAGSANGKKAVASVVAIVVLLFIGGYIYHTYKKRKDENKQ